MDTRTSLLGLQQVLARNLFAARTAAELSQTQLATAAGTSRATIAQLEAGEGNPTLATLSALADSLETTVLMLILGSDEVVALEMVAAGLDLDMPAVADAVTVWEEVKPYHDSPLPRSRRAVARVGADAFGDEQTASPRRRVGAAIGTAIMPGFGTMLGAVLGDAASVIK